ncbi:hypothetical protein [Bradyrhizobium yuanmingense]|uniref:hypothetical protein n=1 Tax=Bradyrhizobium yuanmingense TaxID=108015 RepID=UPI001CD7656C|nr:hypothetical protein [Bradyrhizobium yuanmingense]MCA1526506.1 hypothetical protein [Bradyrhizobium yuanmingense]
MDRYIARANIDHYIGRLSSNDLTPDNRSTIIKMLVEEEDKLSHDLEQFEFAEQRAAAGRKRVNQVTNLRDGFAFGTCERRQADELLVNIENLQTHLEDACHRLRRRINSHRL